MNKSNLSRLSKFLIKVYPKRVYLVHTSFNANLLGCRILIYRKRIFIDRSGREKNLMLFKKSLFHERKHALNMD